MGISHPFAAQVPTIGGSSGNWGRSVAFSQQDLLALNMIHATLGRPCIDVELKITMRRCINCCAPIKEAYRRVRAHLEFSCLHSPALDARRERKQRRRPNSAAPVVGERLTDARGDHPSRSDINARDRRRNRPGGPGRNVVGAWGRVDVVPARVWDESGRSRRVPDFGGRVEVGRHRFFGGVVSSGASWWSR